MVLVSKHGQRYACELPWQPESDEGGRVKEGGHPDTNVTTLLLPLKDRPCLIKVAYNTIEQDTAVAL